MILYHGSYMEIKSPNVSFSRDNLDFGRGFYTAPIKEQAESWSIRFKRKHGQSVVSMYDFNEISLNNHISVLKFEEYSIEWLDFIISCRRGKNIGDYELVIGGIANDKVFDTIQLFLDCLINKEESIKRLRYEKPNIQYCFRSQSIIDKYLSFMQSEVF